MVSEMLNLKLHLNLENKDRGVVSVFIIINKCLTLTSLSPNKCLTPSSFSLNKCLTSTIVTLKKSPTQQVSHVNKCLTQQAEVTLRYLVVVTNVLLYVLYNSKTKE